MHAGNFLCSQGSLVKVYLDCPAPKIPRSCCKVIRESEMPACQSLHDFVFVNLQNYFLLSSSMDKTVRYVSVAGPVVMTASGVDFRRLL